MGPPPGGDTSEIVGIDAIRRFVAKEFVGDKVTMDVVDVEDHYGDIIVRAKYDGTYAKTNLPEELIMSTYFSVRDDKIVSMTVIFNQPSDYREGRRLVGRGEGRRPDATGSARSCRGYAAPPVGRRRHGPCPADR